MESLQDTDNMREAIRIADANSGLVKEVFGEAVAVPVRKGWFKVAAGYVMVKLPEDSPFRCMADKYGWVYEHRLVVAQALGRPLLSTEEVHHKTGSSKDDNRYPETLELCKSKSEHMVKHDLRKEVAELQKENRLLKWQVRQLREQQRVMLEVLRGAGIL